MKFPWKMPALLFLLSCSAVMAQKFSIDPASVKIDREFVKAPIFQAQRTYKTISKPAHDVKWLQFLIAYTPKTEFKSGKDAQIVWEDDLTVELSVLIPAKKDKGYGEVVLLTGKQVLYSVPGDGRVHYVLFQIPPAVLTKYSGFAAYDRDAETGNVYAAVVFRKGGSQTVLATGYTLVKGKTSADIAKIFSTYHKSKIGVLRLEDAVLPKEKTPWQWIDTDLFDFPKSMMEGKQ